MRKQDRKYVYIVFQYTKTSEPLGPDLSYLCQKTSQKDHMSTPRLPGEDGRFS